MALLPRSSLALPQGTDSESGEHGVPVSAADGTDVVHHEFVPRRGTRVRAPVTLTQYGDL